MGILQRTQGSMVRAMCGVQLNDGDRSMDLMFMLGLSETIDQLSMAQCSLVWLCVEERGWPCLEKDIGF